MLHLFRDFIDDDAYMLYREWRLGRYLKKARGRRVGEMPGFQVVPVPRGAPPPAPILRARRQEPETNS
jgi:hypothetical protein